MCDKTILENDFLGSIPDCYKDQKMCNQAVNNYVHALEFVSECCRTCKICDKAVNTYLSRIQFVPKSYKTQEMCDKAVNKSFVFDSIFDWYKTVNKYWKMVEMYDKVIYEDPFYANMLPRQI